MPWAVVTVKECRCPTGLTMWGPLPGTAIMHILRPGPCAGLFLVTGQPDTADVPMTRIEHPSASGTYTSRAGARSASRRSSPLMEVVAVTRADRAITYSTIGAVSVVALVAAFMSYRHALQVIRAHGESGALALAYPLTIDGLIYCASMVLLNAAWQASGATG